MAVLLLLAGPVWAQTDNAVHAITLYAGQGVDHNLRQLPEAIVSADIRWEESYLTALAFSDIRGPLGQHSALFRETIVSSLHYGYEVLMAHHRGLQSLAEVGVAARLLGPDLNVGPLAMSFGTGLGLSHALGTPSYEDGPLADPARRYRTQLLVLFDIEWQMRGQERMSLVTRIHHRSGAYGLIAPSNVGSNFLAAGLRYRF